MYMVPHYIKYPL